MCCYFFRHSRVIGIIKIINFDITESIYGIETLQELYNHT